jgi:hypothetical protein
MCNACNIRITSTVGKHEKSLKHLAAIGNDTSTILSESCFSTCSSCNKYRVDDHNVEVKDLNTWFGENECIENAVHFDTIDRIVFIDGAKFVVRNSRIVDNNIIFNSQQIPFNHKCNYFFINKIELDTGAVNNWFSLPVAIHTSDGIFSLANDQETC